MAQNLPLEGEDQAGAVGNWLMRPGPGKLKYVADVAKTYAAALSVAAVITPAFAAHAAAPVNAAWLIVALMLLVVGLILTPQE